MSKWAGSELRMLRSVSITLLNMDGKSLAKPSIRASSVYIEVVWAQNAKTIHLFKLECKINKFESNLSSEPVDPVRN